MQTILVVDDSSVSRRIISYTLQQHEYNVITATNGREALNLLRNTSVDLVIADLAKPLMDGLTLLRRMRADDQLCAVLVIMLTASGQEHDRIEAIAAGVHTFLTKPTSSRELVAIVNNVLALENLPLEQN